MTRHNASRALLLLIPLTACSGHWEKPGGTASSLEYDRGQCRATAAQTYPPRIENVIIRPARTYSLCDRPGASRNCVRGDFSMHTESAVYETRDVHADLRERSESSCMSRKGWRWVIDSPR